MKKRTFKKIKSFDELKSLASTDDGIECMIVLNGGIGSRKHIYYSNKKFSIYSYIDEYEQEFTEKAIMNPKRTMIGLAITKGALIY